MADFLAAYSIQSWLESCPQGYLVDTEYGHDPDAREPDFLLANDVLRHDAIRTTVQLVVGAFATFGCITEATSCSALRRDACSSRRR